MHFTRLSALRFGSALLAVLLWVATAPSQALANDAHQRFDQEALDAMIAPIALYPDQLLTQVLMAATYPQEVEEAARWSRARPGLTGDAAVRTAEGFGWDPSVHSLTAFPQVLDTMARHMAWTEDIGRAFIVQPQEVMDTVQRLRYRAREAGTLASSESARVIDTGSSLVIESIRPEIVYVPHYDTTVVYGPWWWPARPPMYWPRWHGYYDPFDRPRVVHWGPGTWVNSGFFFGGFDWPRREVRVINTRSYYYARHVHAQPVPYAAAPHVWRHDQARRNEWRRRTQPTERPVQAQQQLAPQARPQPPATGAAIPREVQVQGDENDRRFERRARRGRDADDPPMVPQRSGANPGAQRQIAPQATPQPPATGAAMPREAQVQRDGSDPRFERRGSRSRDSDDPPVVRQRSAVHPAAQPPAAARMPTLTPTEPAPVRSTLPPSDASREDAPRRRASRGRDSD